MNGYICLILAGLALLAGATIAANLVINWYFKAKSNFMARILLAASKAVESAAGKTGGGKCE